MPRMTEVERKRLLVDTERLINQGLSLNQIARLTGKSPQAVHQFLQRHNLMTVRMQRRAKKNVDNENATGDKETPTKED